MTSVAALRDRGTVSFALPQRQRLIPQTVLRRGTVIGPAQFGFELGTGVRTYVTSTAPYLLATSVVVAAPRYTAVLVAAAGFAFGRWVPVLRVALAAQPQVCATATRKSVATVVCGAAILTSVLP